jgi:Ca2+-binding EF-hand superfamily protein
MIRTFTLFGGLVVFHTAGYPSPAGEKAKPDPKKIPPAAVLLLNNTPEDFIKRFDKNKDGYLTKDEVPPFLANNFEKIDRNGDGKLDRQEIALLKEVLRQRFGVEGKSSQEIENIVNALLKQFDKNGDGKISKEEATGPFIAKNFAKFDTNKDGFLNRAELRVAAAAILANRKGGGKGGPLGLPDFDALDANADGRLTRDEVKGSPLFKIFDQIDTNRDGQIDRREFEAYIQKLIEKKSP